MEALEISSIRSKNTLLVMPFVYLLSDFGLPLFLNYEYSIALWVTFISSQASTHELWSLITRKPQAPQAWFHKHKLGSASSFVERFKTVKSYDWEKKMFNGLKKLSDPVQLLL